MNSYLGRVMYGVLLALSLPFLNTLQAASGPADLTGQKQVWDVRCTNALTSPLNNLIAYLGAPVPDGTPAVPALSSSSMVALSLLLGCAVCGVFVPITRSSLAKQSRTTRAHISSCDYAKKSKVRVAVTQGRSLTMERSVKAVVLSAILVVCVPASWAGTMSGQVVDYNAAKVRLANGVLVVPAGKAIYTATSTITMASSFTVTLPSGFQFATAPALTSSAATFVLASGGIGSQFATFTVATSNVSATQTITLGTYTVNGATALETITPIASALPLTMQAVGVDASPVPFREFASDSGIQAIFVGAIQFIDLTPPSNGTKFRGSPDTLTAVISAIAISAETVDFATSTVPILGANGQLNALTPGDTATVVFPGSYGGLASVFLSTNSNCASPTSMGTVSPGALTVPNVPINSEQFFCVTGSGAQIELLGAGPGGYLQNATGFTTVALNPGSSTDFLTSTNVNNEFPGAICYTNDGGSSCVVVNFPAPVPALSFWGMGALAAMLLLFGAWMLKTKQMA